MIIDACILIAALDPGDAHHEAASELLCCDDDLLIHPINLAEVLVGPTRAGRLPAARRLLAVLGVEEAVIAPGEAERLATVRAGTGLRLPDCCVLTLARSSGTRVVATVDARLAAAAREIGLTVRPE